MCYELYELRQGHYIKIIQIAEQKYIINNGIIPNKHSKLTVSRLVNDKWNWGEEW